MGTMPTAWKEGSIKFLFLCQVPHPISCSGLFLGLPGLAAAGIRVIQCLRPPWQHGAHGGQQHSAVYSGGLPEC